MLNKHITSLLNLESIFVKKSATQIII